MVLLLCGGCDCDSHLRPMIYINVLIFELQSIKTEHVLSRCLEDSERDDNLEARYHLPGKTNSLVLISMAHFIVAEGLALDVLVLP